MTIPELRKKWNGEAYHSERTTNESKQDLVKRCFDAIEKEFRKEQQSVKAVLKQNYDEKGPKRNEVGLLAIDRFLERFLGDDEREG